MPKNERYLILVRSWPLIVALGVALALVASINILWLQLNQQEEQEVAMVSHAADINSRLTELLLRAREIEVGQRVYVLTREREFLVPFQEATNKLPVILDRLDELVENEPAEKEKLAQLRKCVSQHIQMNREHLEGLLAGRLDATKSDEVFLEQVAASLTRLLALQRDMAGMENGRLNQRREEFMSSVRMAVVANMVGGVVAVGMIAVAVMALWRENRARRSMESALRLSHEQLERRVKERTAELQERTTELQEEQARLQLAQSAARLGIFDWNIRTGEFFRSPELAVMYGVPMRYRNLPADEWTKLIHADDRAVVENWLAETRRTGRPTEGEWRVIWPDGSVHWLFGRWQAFLDENGEAVSLIGVNLDVTERKRLEQELLEASDNEMRRIGHDLHDGVGQQLTALTYFQATLQAELDGRQPKLADSCRHLGQGLHEVLRHIRLLSHGLAPVPFQETGLEDALQQLAADTSSAAQLDCEFQGGDPVRLEDAQQAAQVYRIAQEAVNNALKHSGARKIIIAFGAVAQGWELTVSDNGRGFDGAAPGRREGLGLRAMRHRAGLMGARFEIQSQPGAGTRVLCAAQR